MFYNVFAVKSRFDGLVGVSLDLEGAEWSALKHVMEDYESTMDDDLSYLSFCIIPSATHLNEYNVFVSTMTTYPNTDWWDTVYIDEMKLT